MKSIKGYRWQEEDDARPMTFRISRPLQKRLRGYVGCHEMSIQEFMNFAIQETIDREEADYE